MTTQHPDESVDDAAWALIGVSVCEASRRLHTFGLSLLCVSFIASFGARGGVVATGLVAALLIAACEGYFAWRLAFDRPVFSAWSRLPEDQSVRATRAFDMALGALLRHGSVMGETRSIGTTASRRSMSSRVAGAKRLHVRQVGAILGQVICLLLLVSRLL
jgi:hypothetical protein